MAPGKIAAIFGAGLGPETGRSGALDAEGLLPGTLGGVEVRFNGTLAPIFYVQSGQVNVQVPYTVAGSETVPVEVRYQGKLAGAASVPVLSEPGTFMFGVFTLEWCHALAVARLRLDDAAGACDLLRTAVEKGWRDLPWLLSDPELAPLQSSPLIQSLIERMRRFPPLSFAHNP